VVVLTAGCDAIPRMFVGCVVIFVADPYMGPPAFKWFPPHQKNTTAAIEATEIKRAKNFIEREESFI
jgi:hypothetical protein